MTNKKSLLNDLGRIDFILFKNKTKGRQNKRQQKYIVCEIKIKIIDIFLLNKRKDYIFQYCIFSILLLRDTPIQNYELNTDILDKNQHGLI